MPNSLEHTERWLELIAEQPLPSKDVFVSHLAVGEITSLCDCGCHGFGFTVKENADLLPLTRSAGLYCEIAFESNMDQEIDILLFTSNQGHFIGADILYGPNVEPMPDVISPVKLKGIWPSGSLYEI